MWRRLAQQAAKQVQYAQQQCSRALLAAGSRAAHQQQPMGMLSISCSSGARQLYAASSCRLQGLRPWLHQQSQQPALQQQPQQHLRSTLLSPLLGGPPSCGGAVRCYAVPVAERKQMANPALKFWKPTSPGQRFRATIRRDGIWRGRSMRCLTRGVNRHSGRNRLGRITVRHRGGGAKKKLRAVDFRRAPAPGGVAASGVVERLEYDPGRSAYIALVNHTPGAKQGSYSYILAPAEVAPGDAVASGEGVPIKPGNALQLRHIPAGMPIHNIELRPGQGGQLCRAAGCVAAIVNKQERHAIVRLPSGEQRLIPLGCRATIGAVSNPQNKNRVIGKAGYNRWRGRRPSVRGVAMNPVDHPHGGNTAGGRPSCSPWGVPCKGYKTRRGYKHSAKWIVAPRPRGKHAGGGT